MFKEALFAAARRPFLGTAVGKAFQYCGWALPVQKVYEDRDALAFRHPRPSYENHLILSPKRAVRNLQQMAQEDGGSAFARIWLAVKTVRARHPEYQSGFTLVANGGKRQDVQQVHFHMFTGDAVVNIYPAREPAERAVFQDGTVIVLQHPRPNWETHYVILPRARDGKRGGRRAVSRGGPAEHRPAGRSVRARAARVLPRLPLQSRERGGGASGFPHRRRAKNGLETVEALAGRKRRDTLFSERKSPRRIGSVRPSALYAPATTPAAGEMRADRKKGGTRRERKLPFSGKRSPRGFAGRREAAGVRAAWKKKESEARKKELTAAAFCGIIQCSHDVRM